MSFEPDHILAPQQGNNANAFVVSVRIMNGVPPSTEQLAELAGRFNLHKRELANSLVGFAARDGQLADSSPYRIVSNSGQHTVMLWPVTRGGQVVEELLRVFCIPANTDAQSGWIPPRVEGQNGTVAPPGAAKAGVTFNLAREHDGDPLLAKNFKRYQTVIQQFTRNLGFFADGQPNNTSVQRWENREWVSKDLKTCVTTYDSLRVNGTSLGNPVGPALLWACVHSYDPGDGMRKFIVMVSIDSRILTVQRTPMGSTHITTLATLDLNTLDAAAVSNAGNSFATLRNWIGKIAHNESQTVLSVWIQNPNAETLGPQSPPTTAFFVGTADFNMGTGELLGTPAAEGETLQISTAGFSGTFATSGRRQIGFAYQGDTKVFTELQFSGAFTNTESSTQTADGPDSPSGTFDYTRSGTDDRQVLYTHGDFSQLLAFVSIDVDTEHQSGTYGFSGGNPTRTVIVNEVAYSATFRSARLLYHNGSPVFEALTSQSVTAQAVGSSSTELTDSITVYADGQAFDLGSNTRSSDSVTRWGTSLPADVRIPTFIGQDSTTTRWGCANRDAMGLIVASGFMAFDKGDAPDTSAFNGRVVNDFVIFSAPKLKPGPANGPLVFALDPGAFVTYCSDPAILAKINAGGEQSVLKAISLR